MGLQGAFHRRANWGLERSIWYEPASAVSLTRALDEPGALFPGDPLFRLRRTLCLETGASVNVARIGHSDHAGTHADLPYHLYADMRRWVPDEAHYRGPGYVLYAEHTLEPPDLDEIPQEAALLLVRTPHGGPARRPILHYPTLSPQAAERLTRLRVKAIIVDVLSVDVADSTTLPVHRLLLEAGIAIVENADLRALSPGSLPWVEGQPVPISHSHISALPMALRAYRRWGWV